MQEGVTSIKAYGTYQGMPRLPLQPLTLAQRGAWIGVTLIRIHLSILSLTPPELFSQYGLPALLLGIENHVGVTIDNCDNCANLGGD